VVCKYWKSNLSSLIFIPLQSTSRSLCKPYSDCCNPNGGAPPATG